MVEYRRNINELESNASLWWPALLSKKEASISIIPKLLETQDQFLSILKLSKDDPDQVFTVLEASAFPPNIFLKHLVVLADFGGETIQRVNSQFNSVFPDNGDRTAGGFEFIWGGNTYYYQFQKLPVSSVLNNKKLKIDGSSLLQASTLDNLTKDIIMVLLHGSSATNTSTAEVLGKCEIGNLIGRPKDLEDYVRQKYIWVSRITSGAQANTLGQVAQQHVAETLARQLGSGYTVKLNGYINGITQNDGRTLITFDIVVGKGEKAIAVEVSFQVTTNSTIERKAGQAVDRYRKLKEKGYNIAYVIDGAGNFQRRSAISTICDNSDCTVAYTDEEFDVLAKFVRQALA